MNFLEHSEVGYGGVSVLFYRWCHRCPERFGDWPWKLGLTPEFFMGHAAYSLGLAQLQGGWEQEPTFLIKRHLLIFCRAVGGGEPGDWELILPGFGGGGASGRLAFL